VKTEVVGSSSKSVSDAHRVRDRDSHRALCAIGTIDGCDIVERRHRRVAGQFGQPPCYAPESFPGRTLDVLANAGGPGNWFGVVTATGRADGTPVLQGTQDPCPGAYVSATSLHLPGPDGKPLRDSSPFKYVDSATVPFIVVPHMVVAGVQGVVLGCRVVVTNIVNGRHVEAVVADTGPSNKLGEISLACARAIGDRSTRRRVIPPTAEGRRPNRLAGIAENPGYPPGGSA
jgi:hypothetical protein